jgi:hypothetical protein
MFHGQNHDRVGKDPHHNRGDAIQKIRGVADDRGKRLATKFRQVNAAQETDGDADERRDENQYATAHNGVRHAAAQLPGR